jgi:hypothetical protein
LGKNGVILISGSLVYINSVVGSLSAHPTERVLVVVDHHYYGQLRNGTPSGLNLTQLNNNLCWTKLRHESVGGATRYVGLFCSPLELDPVVSSLRRTINHIVDYSIRPLCISEKDTRVETFLTLTDRIYPHNLSQSIVYNTQF